MTLPSPGSHWQPTHAFLLENDSLKALVFGLILAWVQENIT